MYSITQYNNFSHFLYRIWNKLLPNKSRVLITKKEAKYTQFFPALYLRHSLWSIKDHPMRIPHLSMGNLVSATEPFLDFQWNLVYKLFTNS